ncbi:MAG TPA: sulfatase-like hydrolase/transferase [Lacibacter sp.]|nr:sulfatase-like hydrolase/transferase [Lacibacter sp.]
MKQLYTRVKDYLSHNALYLFFLPLFFILNGYNQLFGFIPAIEVLINTGAILLLMLLFYFSTRLLFRSSSKAAVFTFIITLVILAFGYLHDTLKDFFPGSAIIKYKYLLPVLGLGAALLVLVLYRTKNTLSGTVLYLNTLMICLFVSEVYNTFKTYQTNLKVQNLIDPNFTVYNQYNPEKKLADSSKPDIYFLIFDEMGGSAALKDCWNIDNSFIDTFLNKKGFYVVPHARSNYSWTVHSVSTTFNMNFMADTLIPLLDDPKSYLYATNSFLNNSLMSILKKEGYDIFQYQPISFGIKDLPGKPFFYKYRYYHFFYKTLPGRIHRDIYWNLSIKRKVQNMKEHNNEKDRILKYILGKVKESASKKDQQKFVYGHFLIPHDPYIYDSSGNLLTPTLNPKRKKSDGIREYEQQLFYADKLIQELVTHIQTNNKKNTVIIVAGDHGYRYYTHPGQDYMYRNMNAIYFPDGNYQTLYPTMSSVNTFRIVLNKYFDAGLPLLKDESIYITPQTQTRFVK